MFILWPCYIEEKYKIYCIFLIQAVIELANFLLLQHHRCCKCNSDFRTIYSKQLIVALLWLFLWYLLLFFRSALFYKLGSPNFFIRGPHKLLHIRSRAGYLA